MKQTFIFLLALLIELNLIAQSPIQTSKFLKTEIDTSNYKLIIPEKEGFQRTYILDSTQIWDINDDSTTYIKTKIKAFIIVEGNIKDDKPNGIFTYFLLDSINPKRKYKLWEQSFFNSKLNGRWSVFSLNGSLCYFETYKNDSLNGLTREFQTDGKTIVKEFEYFGGESKNIFREYFFNGKIKAETHYDDFKLNGLTKRYYDNGNMLECINFTDNEFNGNWKYYYPNGQLWLEKIYKMGKSWEAVASFTKNGEKRNPGTLKNGNGTTIYYNEDGTIREIVTYKNGKVIN